MVSKKEEKKKPDQEEKIFEQLGILGENKKVEIEIKGPFVVLIKGQDGTIEKIYAKTWWKLIFSLGIILREKYTSQFDTGVALKIGRETQKK